MRTNAVEDVEERELSCTVGGNANWGSYRENSMEVLLLKITDETTMTQQSYLYMQMK